MNLREHKNDTAENVGRFRIKNAKSRMGNQFNQASTAFVLQHAICCLHSTAYDLHTSQSVRVHSMCLRLQKVYWLLMMNFKLHSADEREANRQSSSQILFSNSSLFAGRLKALWKLNLILKFLDDFIETLNLRPKPNLGKIETKMKSAMHRTPFHVADMPSTISSKCMFWLINTLRFKSIHGNTPRATSKILLVLYVLASFSLSRNNHNLWSNMLRWGNCICCVVDVGAIDSPTFC